jgi:phosphatidate cytidylyltransferase
MLKQRILTALVLLGILIPALFHSDPFWIAFAGMVLVSAAAWEWGRLNQLGFLSSLLMAVLCVIFCALVWQFSFIHFFDRRFWLLLGGWWVLMAGFLLAGGVQRWSRIPLVLRWGVGVLLLCCTWLALVASKIFSIDFLMSVLLVVWIADIAAYFSGKAFGKHKLAPDISPGKTWEGVVGAVAGVFLLSYAWLKVADYFSWPSTSIFDRLYAHGVVVLVSGLLFLVMMSVAGDLIESLVKRSAGAKDSSQLLPGHGGILDRIDALLPTLPLAVMLALI